MRLYSRHFNHVLCIIAYMLTQMSNMALIHVSYVSQVAITHCMHHMHSHITCALIQTPI